MHLPYGVQETHLHGPSLGWWRAGHVSREAPVLSCSALLGGLGPIALPEKQKRASRFLLQDPPPCERPGGCPPGRTSGHLVAAQLYGIAGSWDIFTGQSPFDPGPRSQEPPTQVWPRCVEGLLSCGFTTSQLLLCLVSGWTHPLAPLGRLTEEICGTLCSLWSAGAPGDGCIYAQGGGLW